MIFKNRKEAAQKLILKLQEYKKKPNVIVLALVRGGIIPAYEIAKELDVALDVILCQKIGAPNFPELAIGAITEDGITFFNENISDLGVDKKYIEEEKKKKKKEAIRRANLYRKNLPILNLKDKIVLLVDDGIATGATMLVAIKSAKAKKAKKIVVVTPVISFSSLKKIEKEVDQIIYLDAPLNFEAVGQFYEHFEQVKDDKVIELLKRFHEKS